MTIRCHSAPPLAVVHLIIIVSAHLLVPGLVDGKMFHLIALPIALSRLANSSAARNAQRRGGL
jgi:hypothetical protein